MQRSGRSLVARCRENRLAPQFFIFSSPFTTPTFTEGLEAFCLGGFSALGLRASRLLFFWLLAMGCSDQDGKDPFLIVRRGLHHAGARGGTRADMGANTRVCHQPLYGHARMAGGMQGGLAGCCALRPRGVVFPSARRGLGAGLRRFRAQSYLQRFRRGIHGRVRCRAWRQG